jgi:hypothetical protein
VLSNYITRDELYSFVNISEYVASSDEVDAALGTATYTIAETLRGRGIDPARVQLPAMFEPVGPYEGISYLAGTHTTSTLDAGNQSRLVLELRTEVTAPVTVTLEGSQDEATWRAVKDVRDRTATIEAQADGTFSVLVVPRHKHYRARLTCEETVDAALYMVDTAPDACIRWKAIETALLPRIDANTTIGAVWEEARQSYDSALGRLVLDYDRDDSGTIDENDKSARMTSVRLYR